MKYSGNPGVNDESYRGATWIRLWLGWKLRWDWVSRRLLRDHNLLFSWSTEITDFPPIEDTVCLGWNAEPAHATGSTV